MAPRAYHGYGTLPSVKPFKALSQVKCRHDPGTAPLPPKPCRSGARSFILPDKLPPEASPRQPQAPRRGKRTPPGHRPQPAPRRRPARTTVHGTVGGAMLRRSERRPRPHKRKAAPLGDAAWKSGGPEAGLTTLP
ncbi:cell wall protein [Citreicella sp. SE45]|nr:cell wall protein [Citreicella sp. SE45]